MCKCVLGGGINNSYYCGPQWDHWCNKEKETSFVKLWLLGAHLGPLLVEFFPACQSCGTCVSYWCHNTWVSQIWGGRRTLTHEWLNFLDYKPMNIRDLHTVYCEGYTEEHRNAMLISNRSYRVEWWAASQRWWQ